MADAKDKKKIVNVEAGVYAPEGVKVTFVDVPQDGSYEEKSE